MELSACIVVYNGAGEAIRAAQTVLDCTRRHPLTLYLVDNASPDGSGQRLAKAAKDGTLHILPDVIRKEFGELADQCQWAAITGPSIAGEVAVHHDTCVVFCSEDQEYVSWVADLFRTAGADRIMSVDLHAAQAQGFFDGPVDHLWAMPTLHKMPLQLQWSGACLVMLMLGWPLTIPTLALVGLIACLLSPGLEGYEALRLTVWHGMLPATLGMLWGVLQRHWLGTKVFVYILGRGFFATVFSLFAASMLAAAAGQPLPGVNEDLSTIARWLMAWGDAVVTGMVCAICVAYRPGWLATWSDDLYLK